jgi:hypothetical protein
MISVLVVYYRYPQIESWLEFVDVWLICKIANSALTAKEIGVWIKKVCMMTRCYLLGVIWVQPVPKLGNESARKR